MNHAEPKHYIKITSTWLDKKPSARAGISIAVLTLFLVIVSVLHTNNILGLHQLMQASNKLVFQDKEFWRLWTTLFAHADQKHLLSNAFMFFIFGFFLIAYYGYFIFPFFAFLFGGVINLVVLRNMPEETVLIGISGVVFWMAGAWLSLYFMLDTKRSYWHRALRALGIIMVLFMPSEAFEPNISYKSHFVGLGLGLLFGLGYYFLNRKQFHGAQVFEIVEL